MGQSHMVEVRASCSRMVQGRVGLNGMDQSAWVSTKQIVAALVRQENQYGSKHHGSKQYGSI